MSDQSVKGNGRTRCHVAYASDVWSKVDGESSTLPENFMRLQIGNKVENCSSSLSGQVDKKQERHRSAVFSDRRFWIVFPAAMCTL